MPRTLLLLLFLAACQSAPPQPEFRSYAITVESRGVSIPGTWVTPVKTGAGPVPVVIMAHGHGGSRDEAGGFTRAARELAQRGIASIRIDFPGCGASTESFTQNNLANMLDDIHAARAFALAQPDIDPQRIGLLGYSMGARLAMLDTEKNSYSAIALWAPVGDNGASTMINFVGGNDAWRTLKTDASANGSTVFTTPWGQEQQLGIEWFVELEQSKPMEAIARYAGPVLVVYGDRDQVVAPGVSVAVGKHAVSSIRVRTMRITGAGHGLGFYDGDARHGEKAVNVTVAFFNRSL